jgi:metal-responsive CopG/Arc/MetJ family transcriptional regulator
MQRVSARLPDAVIAKIDQFASDNGVNRSCALKAFVEGELPARREQHAEVADRDELLGLLTERARDGHVTAMKTLLDELRRDASNDEHPAASVIDQLAARRAS